MENDKEFSKNDCASAQSFLPERYIEQMQARWRALQESTAASPGDAADDSNRETARASLAATQVAASEETDDEHDEGPPTLDTTYDDMEEDGKRVALAPEFEHDFKTQEQLVQEMLQEELNRYHWEPDQEQEPPATPQGEAGGFPMDGIYQEVANTLVTIARNTEQERRGRVIGRILNVSNDSGSMSVTFGLRADSHCPLLLDMVDCQTLGCTARGHDHQGWVPHPENHNDQCVQMVRMTQYVFQRRAWTTDEWYASMYSSLQTLNIVGTVLNHWRVPNAGEWEPQTRWSCLTCFMEYNDKGRRAMDIYWTHLCTMVYGAYNACPEIYNRVIAGVDAPAKEIVENDCLLWMLPAEIVSRIGEYLWERPWEIVYPCHPCAQGIGTLRPCVCYHEYKHTFDNDVTCPVEHEYQIMEAMGMAMREDAARALRARHAGRNVFKRAMFDAWQRNLPERLVDEIHLAPTDGSQEVAFVGRVRYTDPPVPQEPAARRGVLRRVVPSLVPFPRAADMLPDENELPPGAFRAINGIVWGDYSRMQRRDAERRGVVPPDVQQGDLGGEEPRIEEEED